MKYEETYKSLVEYEETYKSLVKYEQTYKSLVKFEQIYKRFGKVIKKKTPIIDFLRYEETCKRFCWV